MRYRALFYPATILALGTSACLDSTSGQTQVDSDVTIADTDTHQPETDTFQDVRPEETIQPRRPADDFEPPFVLQGLLAENISSVATIDGTEVWMGSVLGLYQASAPDFETRPVWGFAGRAVVDVASIAVRDNGEVIVLDAAKGVASSVDGGQTWTDAAPFPSPELFLNPHLFTNGTAVILACGAGPLFIQKGTGEPWLALSTAFLDADASAPSSLVITSVSFGDDGMLYGSSNGDARPGIFKLNLATATETDALWTRVEGLDAKAGYAAPAFANGKGVTANARDFFVREDGVWRKSFTPVQSNSEEPQFDHQARALATDGDVFVASGDRGLRISTNGVEWQSVSGGPGFLETLVGGAWGFFGADLGRLCGSTNHGDSWTCRPGPMTIAEDVVLLADQIVSVHRNVTGVGRGFVQAGHEEASEFGIPLGIEQLVVADGSLWASAADKKIFRDVGGGDTPLRVDAEWGPTGDPDAQKWLFGNQAGLFAADRREDARGAPYCGLYRYNTEQNAWAAVSNGLPGIEGCDAAVTHLSEVEAIVFVGTATGETYRSADRGAQWTLVGDAVFKAVASCAGRIVALTDDGEIWNSTDRGVSFKRDAGFTLEAASSLTSAAGWCVVGLDSVAGGPTLWASSPDGGAFEPLLTEFVEPVIGLVAGIETLAVSTSSKGIVRIDTRP